MNICTVLYGISVQIISRLLYITEYKLYTILEIDYGLWLNFLSEQLYTNLIPKTGFLDMQGKQLILSAWSGITDHRWLHSAHGNGTQLVPCVPGFQGPQAKLFKEYIYISSSTTRYIIKNYKSRFLTTGVN